MVNVRDRDALRCAEHVTAGHVLGDLVNGAGAELVVRADGSVHGTVVHERTEVVCRGIAGIQGERLTTVLLERAGNAVGNHLPCLLPGDLHVRTVALHERHAQTVRVLVQLLQRAALRADVPAAEDIVPVAADAHDLLTGPDRDLQAARGLAQWARSVHGSVLVRHAQEPATPRRTVRVRTLLPCCGSDHSCRGPMWIPPDSSPATGLARDDPTWRSA